MPYHTITISQGGRQWVVAVENYQQMIGCLKNIWDKNYNLFFYTIGHKNAMPCLQTTIGYRKIGSIR